MNLERFNPVLWDRERIGKKIKETGARFIPLGDGIERTPFEEIMQKTLLGIGSSLLNEQQLSPHERELLQHGNPHVLTILDFDGVFALPLKAIFNSEERKIPLLAFRFLKKAVKASYQVWIFTSRVDADMIRERCPFLRKLVDLFQKTLIDSFPFLDSSSITRLEKFGNSFKGENEGLAVLANKSFIEHQRVMWWETAIKKFFDQHPENSICYIIGSSLFDRRAVLKLCQSHHEFAPKIVYIDTGHLVI
jgi:hypothetical protein